MENMYFVHEVQNGRCIWFIGYEMVYGIVIVRYEILILAKKWQRYEMVTVRNDLLHYDHFIHVIHGNGIFTSVNLCL